MAGTCTFRRIEGVWYQVAACKDNNLPICPHVAQGPANQNGHHSIQGATEAALLAGLRSIFENSFEFADDDVMEVRCSAGQEQVINRLATYLAANGTSREFELSLQGQSVTVRRHNR